jgi:hypothetical protein
MADPGIVAVSPAYMAAPDRVVAVAELPFDPVTSASGDDASLRPGVEPPVASRDKGLVELCFRQFGRAVIDVAASTVRRPLGRGVTERMTAASRSSERVVRVSDEQQIVRIPFTGPPAHVDGVLKPGFPGPEQMIISRQSRDAYVPRRLGPVIHRCAALRISETAVTASRFS